MNYLLIFVLILFKKNPLITKDVTVHIVFFSFKIGRFRESRMHHDIEKARQLTLPRYVVWKKYQSDNN